MNYHELKHRLLFNQITAKIMVTYQPCSVFRVNSFILLAKLMTISLNFPF